MIDQLSAVLVLPASLASLRELVGMWAQRCFDALIGLTGHRLHDGGDGNPIDTPNQH